MADVRRHNNTNNNICLRGLDPEKRRSEETTVHLQWSPKNYSIPAKRHTHNNPVKWNRKLPDRVHNKEKTSPTCQTNRQHAKWIPHQRYHLIKEQWMAKRNKQNRGRTQCQRPNGRNVKRMPEETSPRRNKHQSYGRNRRWGRDYDKGQTLEG